MLAGKYREEINTTNPLGMRGEIADSYGSLIRHLWSGREDAFVPRDFKV
jgi:ubiquitin carboxyl-terminal hydrolase 4/11/15